MKKFISGAAAAALLAMGLVAAAAAPASATYDGEQCVPSDAWTETIQHPAVGEPTITVDNPDYVPAIEGTPSVWAVFSPNDSQGPFEGTPTYPTDDRGTWQIKGQLPGGHEGPDGVYQKGNGNGSWFYRHAEIPGTPAVGEPTIVTENPYYEEPWTETVEHPAVTCPPVEQPVTPIACTASPDWYTEGDDVAPALQPEGYVFQSTDSKVAGLRAAAGGNLQGWSPVTYAASGDTGSFWYRIVLDTSADGGWGYMSATVTSGQPVTSSSTAYVSKLGQSFTLADLAKKYPHNVITSVGFHLDRGHGPVTLSAVGGACGSANFTTEKPADVVTTDNSTPVITCDSKVGDVIEVTNIIHTTPFVWDGSKFVAGVTVDTSIGGTYTVTQEDIDALDCAVVVPPTEEPKPTTPAPVTAPVTTADALATTGDATSGIYTVLAGVLLAAGGIIMVSRRIARR